jgi:hypothetical protein
MDVAPRPLQWLPRMAYKNSYRLRLAGDGATTRVTTTQPNTGGTWATSVIGSGHSGQTTRSQATVYTRQPGTYQGGGGVDDGFI